MNRTWSLAYLTTSTLTAPQAISLAAEIGCQAVGLRLMPNAPGAPQQILIDRPEVLRETLAVQRDTGVGVYDLEIIRIAEGFALENYRPLLDAGASLGAKAVLVAGDDSDASRLAAHYARLCEMLLPYGLTADLEYMPWTPVKDARSALAIVEAAGRPSNAGILVDALHTGRSTTTLDDLRAIPRELLHYAQICDATTEASHGRPFTLDELIHTARCERLLPGEGEIDVVGIFGTLPDAIPVSVEIPSDSRVAALGAKEWARRALEAGRAALHRN